MSNPLLDFNSLPAFDSIKAEHVIPALEDALEHSRDQVAKLSGSSSPTWENFALVMEDIDDRLNRLWSPVEHLNAVQDNADLREAYQQGISLLTQYHSEIGQNKALYEQYKQLQQSAQFTALSPAQKKVIHNNLLDFKLAGADLNEQEQAIFRQIKQQLAELSNTFERNLLDATQAWSMTIEDIDQLAGLPQSSLQMAQQLAEQADKQGYLFNLQIPSYLGIMQYADNAQLREKMYRAYCTRASEQSTTSADKDNSLIIEQILQLRQQLANLLGYEHYAQYSLVKKMAKSVDDVNQFLNNLVEYAKPVAEKELQQLRDFAKQHYQVDNIEPWDISYYSEKLREQLYAFTDEQVKPYFPAPKVFNGLFEIVRRLFNIHLRANDQLNVWHDDVRCFDVLNSDQELIGQLYTDLYVRENKRGGAWMGGCVDRRKKQDQTQLPVAFLTCNFSPPIGDDPALLTHDEVETLFHEFGHCLHHLLTQVDELSVSGINGVAWDAVELPSQFLENWCWQEESLQLIANHYQTGDALPSDLLNKMRSAKNFQSGLQTLRQVEFASFDMRIHCANDITNNGVQETLDQVRQEIAVLMPPAYNRFQNSFGHIFAGGYAAGYYSYKWAEVLSADAFERFIEEGIFNAQTGQDFAEAILQRGGVDDVNDLFIEFRKREPKIEPLLKQTGIL